MMKPTKNAIAQHLNENLGHYINPFNVETTLSEDGIFNMDARWPEPLPDPDYVLEISTPDATPEVFSKLSGIKTVEQLLFVSPHMLIELYQMGLAYVMCMVQKDRFFYQLYFRQKPNGKYYSYDIQTNKTRLVKRPLQTAEDFYEYTRDFISRL